MDDKPQDVCLRYYGISPWEIEVIYNLFNEKKWYCSFFM